MYLALKSSTGIKHHIINITIFLCSRLCYPCPWSISTWYSYCLLYGIRGVFEK